MPRVDDRRVVNGNVYVIRNGLQLTDAPAGYGSDGRLLDRLKPFIDHGEELDDLAEIGTVVSRLLELLELVGRRFHAAPDDGHFRAELRAHKER